MSPECPYYPCHNLVDMDCQFCYCPFYPCGDGRTGGKWLKGKGGEWIFSCEDCVWIHKPQVVRMVRRLLLQGRKDLKNIREEVLRSTLDE